MPSSSSPSSSSFPSASSSLAPTIRSRTLLFLSYRDSTPRPSNRRTPPFPSSRTSYGDTVGNGFAADDEHERLISHADTDEPPGHIALGVDLPPKWVDIADQVQDILAATQQKISLLERLHAKHVLPGFADRSAEEREIEAVTTDITRDFRRCQALIQSIPTASQHHAFPPRSQAQQQSHHERLAAQNVQRALAAQVQEMSATLRKKQRVYLETLQGHAIKNQDLLVASGALTLKGPESISDLDEDMRVASQNQYSSSLASRQQQLHLQQVDDVDASLLQRDREITEIAKSIGTLAELFKDLSTLVIDQGTLLDSVEYNIEQTAIHMQESVTELKVAEGYQRNTGRRKCIFLLLLIIFGLVVVLIFKPKRHGYVPTSTSVVAEATKMGEEGQLPPIPIDVTTLDPEAIGFGANADAPVSSTGRRTRRRRTFDGSLVSAPNSRSTRTRARVRSGMEEGTRITRLRRTRAPSRAYAYG